MLSLFIAVFPFIIVIMLLGISLLDILFFSGIFLCQLLYLFLVILINSFSVTTACLVLLLLGGKYVIVRNYLFFDLYPKSYNYYSLFPHIF